MGSSPPWRVGSSLALRHQKATPPEPSLRYNQGIDCKSQASFLVPLFLASAQQQRRCLQRPALSVLACESGPTAFLPSVGAPPIACTSESTVWQFGSAKIGVAFE